MGAVLNSLSSVLPKAKGVNKAFGKQDSMSSNWGSLHPDLLATFTPVDIISGQELASGTTVQAPIKEGSIEQEFNWISPFETISAENKHPTLMALMQTGGGEQLSQVLAGAGLDKLAGKSLQTFSDIASYTTGRTGITKLNSRQVFAGHAPLKMSMTVLFRAWQDPTSEVVKPFKELLKMAYPEKLAHSQLDALKEGKADLDLLFPSKAPNPVRFSYKGETYPLMVIESIGKPMDAPYSIEGDLWLEVSITLCSLNSYDFNDIDGVYTSQKRLGDYINKKIDSILDFF